MNTIKDLFSESSSLNNFLMQKFNLKHKSDEKEIKEINYDEGIEFT